MLARLYVDGPYPIWLLYGDNGRGQAADFLESLADADRDKADRRLVQAASRGAPSNCEQFRTLGGQVFEFKIHGFRFLGFRAGSGFVVARGIKKSGARTTRREIEFVRALAESFRSRGEFE